MSISPYINPSVYFVKRKNKLFSLLRCSPEKSHTKNMLKDIKRENLLKAIGSRRGAKADLARKLGCTPQYINKLCNLGGGISDDKAIELARALHIDVKELYAGSALEIKNIETRGAHAIDEFILTCYTYRNDSEFRKLITAFVAYKKHADNTTHETVSRTIDLLLKIIDAFAIESKINAKSHRHGHNRTAANSTKSTKPKKTGE